MKIIEASPLRALLVPFVPAIAVGIVAVASQLSAPATSTPPSLPPNGEACVLKPEPPAPPPPVVPCQDCKPAAPA